MAPSASDAVPDRKGTQSGEDAPARFTDVPAGHGGQVLDDASEYVPMEQEKQTSAPASENVDGPQGEQKVELVSAANDPEGHESHEVAPVSSMYLRAGAKDLLVRGGLGAEGGGTHLPAAQSVQTSTPTIAEDFPAGQSWQEAADAEPREGLNVPSEHGSHADAPVSSMYLPTAHWSHAPTPSSSEAVPAGHGRQEAMEADPVSSLNVPVGHGSQAVAPVSSMYLRVEAQGLIANSVRAPGSRARTQVHGENRRNLVRPVPLRVVRRRHQLDLLLPLRPVYVL
jgi:hypothetical protein